MSATTETNSEKKSETKAHRTIYVLRTHMWNASVEGLWESLVSDLGPDVVWVLYDGTRGQPAKVTENPRRQVVWTTEDECRKINPLHSGCYANVESQLCLFDRKLSSSVSYDFLWLIEYDVRSHGNWKNVLGKVDHLDVDFLATGMHHTPDSRGNKWRLASGYTIADNFPELPAVPTHVSFFPVTRHSREFLHYIRDRYLGKVTTFCEFLFPTACIKSGYRMKQIPGDMLSEVFGWHPQYSDEEYQQWQLQTKQKNVLAHPVMPADRITRGSTSTTVSTRVYPWILKATVFASFCFAAAVVKKLCT